MDIDSAAVVIKLVWRVLKTVKCVRSFVLYGSRTCVRHVMVEILKICDDVPMMHVGLHLFVVYTIVNFFCP